MCCSDLEERRRVEGREGDDTRLTHPERFVDGLRTRGVGGMGVMGVVGLKASLEVRTPTS